MPQIGFDCKKGKVRFAECLQEGFCEDRCLSRSSLLLLSKQRPWTGVPSTTQLIKGTMQAFLEITVDFYVNPDSQMFMLQGTKAHMGLESDDEYSFIEEAFKGDHTGIADVLEMEKGVSTLIDYKLSGSFMVAKALGYYTVDMSTGEFYKSGAKKGQEKTKKKVCQSDDKVNMIDWILQINDYRMKFEKAGFHVDKMKIQAIVRDGNTGVAKSRGVMQNSYMIDVPRLGDEEVKQFFKRKRNNLLSILELTKARPDEEIISNLPETCTTHERWDDKKCKNFCNVAFACEYGSVFADELKLI